MNFVFVTVIVNPWWTLDPFNLPKMVVLGFCGIISTSILVLLRREIWASDFRYLFILISVFILQLLLVSLFSGAGILTQLYGVNGRNTGLLTYTSLSVTLFTAASQAGTEFLLLLRRIFFYLGAADVIFSLVQFFGINLLPLDNSYPSHMIGFLGNPDFNSAFLGIFFCGLLAFGQHNYINHKYDLKYLFLALVTLLDLVLTKVSQGLILIVFGIFAITLGRLYQQKSRFVFPVLLLGIATSISIFQSFYNKGVLAHYLFKPSSVARTYYWEAAIKMFKRHPFFGVGMDQYGQNYRLYRPKVAAQSASGLVSDAAHNVYLDLLSTAGALALLVFLVLILFAIKSFMKVMRREPQSDINYYVIAISFFAYLVQATISINQIALANLGWLFLGAVIGFEKVTSPDYKTKYKILSAGSSIATLRTKIGVTAGITLATLTVLPPYIASASYLSALKSGDFSRITKSVKIWPYDEVRFAQVALGLQDSKFPSDALAVVNLGLKKFPDSYRLWDAYSKMQSASIAEVSHAKAEMKRLDPYNPDLK